MVNFCAYVQSQVMQMEAIIAVVDCGAAKAGFGLCRYGMLRDKSIAASPPQRRERRQSVKTDANRSIGCLCGRKLKQFWN
jgi:hypothetical protein